MNPDIHYFSHCWWPRQADRRRLTLIAKSKLMQIALLERLVKTKKGQGLYIILVFNTVKI